MNGFRHDIEGLRGLAVLLVVLFHLEVPGVSGGYVGVDVFFVISGFVVTRALWPRMQKGEFRFRNFYANRFWRLQPSFFLVTTVTLVASYFVVSPVDFFRTAQSAGAAAALSANFFFWQTTTGYEGADAILEPFLQMWSLAVEEQFYIIWPGLLLFVHRLKILHRRFLGVLLLLAGLALSEFMTLSDAGMAYFLLPARIFELALGAMLVSTEDWKLPRLARLAGVAVGTTMVLGSSLWLTKFSAFPGVNAVLPTLGTALIIQGGAGLGKVNVIFTNAVARYVGRVSYAWYLWHWPAIALAHYVSLLFTPALTIAVFSGTFALASATYHLWETPTRRKPSRVWKWAVLGSFVMAASLIGAALSNKPPLLQVAEPGDNDELGYKNYECLFKAQSWRELDKCSRIESPQGKRLLIWGDSHASILQRLIEKNSQSLGWTPTTVTSTGCPPLFGVHRDDPSPHSKFCQGQVARHVNQLMARFEFDAILIVGRFGLYENGWIKNGRLKKSTHFISDEITTSETAADSAAVLRRKLIRTMEYLVANQEKPILFMLPTPHSLSVNYEGSGA